MRRHTPALSFRYESGRIGITATTIDQDTPTPTPREFTAWYPAPAYPLTVAAAVEHVLHLVNVFVGHEVLEAFHFNGRRWRDPHSGFRP